MPHFQGPTRVTSSDALERLNELGPWFYEFSGFRRTEIVDPPADAYEQHRRAKRLVCIAYK